MEDPMVQVWFGDSTERELMPEEMYLAVYAAGGGKRNMANFVRAPAAHTGEPSLFRTSDVHVFLSSDREEVFDATNTKLFVCRYASSRGEWVPKPVGTYQPGMTQLKLIPEWFKARFWDNKQEKKHPWFMFGFLCEAADGTPRLFTSSAFPVHQYYPTGLKKTDPNDPACRSAFHRVLKQAPSSTLRPETLLRRTTPSSSFDVLPYTPAAQQSKFGSPESVDMAAASPSSESMRYSKGWRHQPASSASSWNDANDMELDDDDDDESDYDTPRSPLQQSFNQFYADKSMYTEPMKSIGKRGLVAAEALLALRSVGMGPQR